MKEQIITKEQQEFWDILRDKPCFDEVDEYIQTKLDYWKTDEIKTFLIVNKWSYDEYIKERRYRDLEII